MFKKFAKHDSSVHIPDIKKHDILYIINNYNYLVNSNYK